MPAAGQYPPAPNSPIPLPWGTVLRIGSPEPPDDTPLLAEIRGRWDDYIRQLGPVRRRPELCRAGRRHHQYLTICITACGHPPQEHPPHRSYPMTATTAYAGTGSIRYEVVTGIDEADRVAYIDSGDGSWISQDARVRADREYLRLITAGCRVGLFVNGEHKAGHDFAEEWAAWEVEAAQLDAEWAAYQRGEPIAERRKPHAPERHFDLSSRHSCPDWRGWATKVQTKEIVAHTQAAFDMKPYPAWTPLGGRFWIVAEVIAVTQTTVTLRYLRRDNTKGVSTVARPPALTLPKPQPHKISYSAGSEPVREPGGPRYGLDGSLIEPSPRRPRRRAPLRGPDRLHRGRHRGHPRRGGPPGQTTAPCARPRRVQVADRERGRHRPLARNRRPCPVPQPGRNTRRSSSPSPERGASCRSFDPQSRILTVPHSPSS